MVSETVMFFMLPVIIEVFEKITEPSYKMQFNKPCDFNEMLHMFSTLPPYFNAVGKLYANQTDLLAYYSMQLASTVLVNKNILTMECLYNMLDLQSKFGKFALGLLKNPEDYKNEIGKFGTAMKNHQSIKELINNPMLKILEHVDKYEKNNNKEQNLLLFNTFNIVFIVVSLIGIIGNLAVCCLLKRGNAKNYNNLLDENASQNDETSSKSSNKVVDQIYVKFFMRYTTLMYIILIAICHLFYLKINFIIMSQFKLAELALKYLNNSNFACKIAFFLFPPTTTYNILQQYAIWLLIFALKLHSKKIRSIKQVKETEDDTDDLREFRENYNFKEILTINNKLDDDSIPMDDSFYVDKTKQKYTIKSYKPSKNIFICIFIFALILIYNSKNLVLYSLNEVFVKTENKTITFCAFSSNYSNYYLLLSQQIFPFLNLFLFVFLPLIIGIKILWFDFCLFIRLKREKKRHFKLLNDDHIEWLLYVFFLIFSVSQLPLFVHHIIDLAYHNKKFPFIFPLFISIIFSNKVTLVLIEMSLLCLSYSVTFFACILFEKNFKNIIKFYFYKYILCRSLILND